VPIYEYRCDCGLRFERLLPVGAEPPGCPDCGGATRKIPAGSSLGGRAGGQPANGRSGKNRPPADSGAPPWHGLRAGGPEKVQREVKFRQRLEATQAGSTAPGAAGGERGAGGGTGAAPTPAGS
jgi:putative FmdB family regulatory protein